MTTDLIKPCPFCGGKARVMMMDEKGYEITNETYEANHDEGQTYDEWVGLVLAGHTVMCDECDACVSGWIVEEAVEKWNRRAI